MRAQVAPGCDVPASVSGVIAGGQNGGMPAPLVENADAAIDGSLTNGASFTTPPPMGTEGNLFWQFDANLNGSYTGDVYINIKESGIVARPTASFDEMLQNFNVTAFNGNTQVWRVNGSAFAGLGLNITSDDAGGGYAIGYIPAPNTQPYNRLLVRLGNGVNFGVNLVSRYSFVINEIRRVPLVPQTSISTNSMGCGTKTLTANVNNLTSGDFTYQWYLNGAPISGATGKTHVTGSSGAAANYQVTTTVGDGGCTFAPTMRKDTAAISFSACTLTDTDGDGVPDGTDLDDDNDGINNAMEDAACGTANCDTDGDGLPNRLDLDSDNDGVNDVNEAHGVDANGDGKADGSPGANGEVVPGGLTPLNTDGTGAADPYDTDSDGDGVSDLKEAGLNPSLDADNNGRIDCTGSCDPDKDGILAPVDGLPNARGDKDTQDTDGDGVVDTADLDDDNDGINDTREEAACTTANCDTDGDGLLNRLDLDSDNDGINDVVEANGTDANGDGKVDGSANSNGEVISGGLTPPNTDGVGATDPYDTDSDGDGISDLKEKGLSPSLDADNNGMIDCMGSCDPDRDGILTLVDGLPDTWGDKDVQDTDGDGVVDDMDLDDDNDGINDTAEEGACTTGNCDTDGDGLPNRLDLDSDNDGINDVIEARGTDADGDGKIDGAPNANGEIIRGGLTPPNSDGTDASDPYDTNSDGDGAYDWEEAGLDPSLDANRDGMIDCAGGNCDPDKDGILAAVDGLPDAWGDKSALAPDLTPNTELGFTTFAREGAVRNLLVQLQEIKEVSTQAGVINFSVVVSSGYTLSFNPALTTFTPSGASAVTVQNDKWTATSQLGGARLIFQAKAGTLITAKSISNLGITITRSGATAGTTGSVTVIITADNSGAGYDSDATNNAVIRPITAQ